MRQQFKRLHLTLREQPSAETFAIAGVREQRREGATVVLEIRQNLEQVMAAAAPSDRATELKRRALLSISLRRSVSRYRHPSWDGAVSS